jgi:hypothetical protein
VVIDPVVSTVTDIVVEPVHRSGLGRLVPMSLVITNGDAISLDCNSVGFESLPCAEETDYLPGGSGPAELQAFDAYFRPFVGIEDPSDPLAANASGVIVRDTPPRGTLELRKDQQWCAQSRPVGRVVGITTDKAWRINFVLLRERKHWMPRVHVVPFNRASGPIL